jgi:DNA polymerase III psi subunit
MEELNPMSIQFLFEDTFFHFNEGQFISQKNTRFFGENKSNICLISKSTFQNDDFDLLSKILSALKMSLDDVALISQKPEEGYLELIKELKTKKIILFDINPFEIGFTNIASNTYEIVEFENIQLLQAEKFNEYHINPVKKKALWLSLQKLFA